jgi:predicted nucleic acid-binding protein
MEWLDTLQGRLVGLDTAPLIYFIEEHPDYIHLIRPFFEALDRGEFTAVTSVVTLLEVLVQPLRHNDERLAQHYREILLEAEGLRTVMLSADLAEEAAWLRADHRLRTPDAIQLAAARHEGAAFFLTNDARLPSVPGLTMLLLDELKAMT